MIEKKKKRLNKYLYYLLLILIPISFFFGSILIYQKFFEQENTIPSVEKLKKEKEEINYQDKNDKPDVSNYVNELPSYRQQYNNELIQGKLEISQLNINALVTRASNNEFYLNYNLYNQKDGLGVPFFDYRNTDLNNDRQINIYGHNTQNPQYLDQLPFVNLEAYTDKNIFDNYKNVYLSIDERKIEYEVIAIKIITDGNNEHMKLVFYSDDDYISHVSRLLSNTLYKSNDKITKDDRLLILQVCHYDPPGSYLLVICKEVK